MATDKELEKFNSCLNIIKQRFLPAQFKEAFIMEDKDKSGFLEPNEIKKIVKDILNQLFPEGKDFDFNSEEGQQMLDDKVNAILKQFDENGDKKLEFIEFKKLMLLVLIEMIPKLFGYEHEKFLELAREGKDRKKIAKENIPICNELIKAISNVIKSHY